ncbi:hypothetical protein XENOCAPTIV_013814 [Xenoophorus captivus]|uniref:Uncharacterized protein n=1 Tax=Xenoophorus captivus TaxID=1517983 RepID=A0ABV0Q5N5_9TELE
MKMSETLFDSFEKVGKKQNKEQVPPPAEPQNKKPSSNKASKKSQPSNTNTPTTHRSLEEAFKAVSNEEQLRCLYPRLKVLAFGAKPESTLHTYLPSFLSRATPHCPDDMKREMKMRGHGFPWSKLLMVLLVFAAGFIAHDIRSHDSVAGLNEHRVFIFISNFTVCMRPVAITVVVFQIPLRPSICAARESQLCLSRPGAK